MRKALLTNHPILGICGGLQLMNICQGGTLIQDIASEYPQSNVQHPKITGELTRHSVRLDPKSQLFKIYGRESLSVPTSHHQAVKVTGKHLKAAAFADDGIIEALEHDQKPFAMGVQWHPERDFEQSKNLFDEFVRQAAFVHA